MDENSNVRERKKYYYARAAHQMLREFTVAENAGVC